MLLAGDIGGTKTILAWFQVDREVNGAVGGERWHKVHSREFSSQAFPSLEAVLDVFQAEAPYPVEAACFGIAGPIVGQRSQLTNLDWHIDGSALQQRFGTHKVRLLNDLEVIGHCLPWLRNDELLVLNEGLQRPGNIGILAAGTGLGESLLFFDGTRHNPSASEGGHTDFAPRDEWEIGLWRFLSSRHSGHVSYERILSGQGFTDTFDYLVSIGRTPSAEVAQARATLPNPTPVISDAGIRGSCAVCVEVLEHFMAMYGAEAGNVALKALTLGGIFLGGGIAPRIRESLLNGTFMGGFLDKGRFRGLLEGIPVKVILNPEAGLIGAARFAAVGM